MARGGILSDSPVRLFGILYFQEHGPPRFWLRSGSFFPQLRIFNNFSASFFGSFRFVFGCRSCIFNNFSGSFFKITSFLSHPAAPQDASRPAMFTAVVAVKAPCTLPAQFSDRCPCDI